jgi:hypothetical protein
MKKPPKDETIQHPLLISTLFKVSLIATSHSTLSLKISPHPHHEDHKRSPLPLEKNAKSRIETLKSPANTNLPITFLSFSIPMIGVIPNSDLLNSLVEALTPSGIEFPATSIQSFLATIHPCLPDDSTSSWPDTIGSRVNQIFYVSTFLISLSFGQPKQSLSLPEIIQFTYSSATTSLYLSGIKFFLTTLPLFSTISHSNNCSD